MSVQMVQMCSPSSEILALNTSQHMPLFSCIPAAVLVYYPAVESRESSHDVTKGRWLLERHTSEFCRIASFSLILIRTAGLY